MKKTKIFYFNSTHWDREWYLPFQGYRLYLLETLEGVMNTLEGDPAFKVFCMDGQAIPLEDALEIHPEWRPRLSRIVKNGRLRIGPWFAQPDEFIPSGEALIRNLLLGFRSARSLGAEPWPIGYLCDIFGHCAQMPQILQGFGIDMAVLWRGAPDSVGPYFQWRAPDGSKCVVAHLPSFQGYGDFTGQVTEFWDETIPEAEFKRKAKHYMDPLLDEGRSLVLLMDGVDHAPIHSAAPVYLKWMQELYSEAEIRFSDLCDLNKELRKISSSLPLVEGELTGTAKERAGFRHLITHTLSSYYPQKQANDELQTDMELVMSPLMTFSKLNGDKLDEALLDEAWRQLIRNHPHDSICGCSIDQVHHDMDYRFAQVREICEALRFEFVANDWGACIGEDIRKSCHFISGSKKTAVEAQSDGRLLLRVFNTLPYERNNVESFEVAFPCGYPATFAEPFGYETLNAFVIRDSNGECIPYSITNIRRNILKRFYRYDARPYDSYSLTAQLPLKPLGWTSFLLEPAETPVRSFKSQLSSSLVAETDILKLEVRRDGSMTITDKRSGRSFGNLNVFVADAELGDGWNHVEPKGSFSTFSVASASVRIVENAPMRTSFEIIQSLHIPACLNYLAGIHENYVGIAPDNRLVEVKISTTATIDKDSPLIRFETVVENCAKDWRLRLCIPTGIEGTYFAHQSFCFLERPTGRALGNTTAAWKEPEPLEKNFSEVLGKRDARGGIAFISKAGLHEVSAQDGESGELHLTFLRAFRRTVATNGEDYCQIQGSLSYSYALCLLTPEDSNGRLYKISQIYRAMPLFHVVPALHNPPGDKGSLLLLDSENICLSIIKTPEDGERNAMVVGLTNYSDCESTAELLAARIIVEAWLCDLTETQNEKLKSLGRKLKIYLRPWGMARVKIKLKETS